MFRLVLAAGMAAPLLSGGSAVADSTPRLPVLANDAAWRKLPGAPETAQPLPACSKAWR
ncbi:MAG: hypothetical protein ABGY75_06110 [Gemmataceae bacterium]